MAIFDAGNVGGHESRSPFDVALTEILGFAEFPQALSDLHDSKVILHGG